LLEEVKQDVSALFLMGKNSHYQDVRSTWDYRIAVVEHAKHFIHPSLAHLALLIYKASLALLYNST